MDLHRPHKLTPGLVLAGLLTGLWAIQTWYYTRAWSSQLALSLYVVVHAPEKPRAIMNYAVLLATRGEFKAGRVLLVEAQRRAEYSYIQPWDRRILQADITKNLAALSDLESQ